MLGISDMEMARTGNPSHGEGQMHCVDVDECSRYSVFFLLKEKLGKEDF